MRNLKKKTCKYVLAFLLVLLCAGIADVQPVQAAVKLNTSAVNLCVGDKYQLKLTGTTKKVTWKSSKTSVAKVSSKGMVSAVGKGSATITATCNSKKYSCKVKVNKTFKINKGAVSLGKNAELSIFFSASGIVNYKTTDKSICSVKYWEWDGDNLPITIIPKKVGNTTLTFVNTANSETCTLSVKVTAVPSATSFQSASISTGSDKLVVGENKLNIPFRQQNRTSKKTELRFYDEDGAVVRRINLGTVKKDKKKTASWDGMDDDGNPLSGTFTYAVVADGNKTFAGKSESKAKATVTVISASPFGKGDGTQKNPYRVSNVAELYLMKNYPGACFAQDADIDFEYGMSAQIFDEKTPFEGTFDGSNGEAKYKIMNLCGVNSIFGVIGEKGTIKNICMSNCLLNLTGSLLATTNRGTIEDCTVDGKILCNAGNQAAMLVMYNKGIIRGCSVSGSLTVEATNAIGTTTLRAGGIVFQNSGTIAGCNSSVQINQKITVGTYVPNTVHEIYSGGITAENASGAFVTNCVFIGSIDTSVTLPDTVKDVTPEQVCRMYSGYVAGMNNGIIGNCTNASVTKGLGAKGTGNGTEQ